MHTLNGNTPGTQKPTAHNFKNILFEGPMKRV